MRDMAEMLSELRVADASGAEPIDPAVVEADVARGRRALVGRRRRLVGSGVVAVAATAVMAVTVSMGGQSGSGTQSEARSTAAGRQSSVRVELASYHGAQPAGFEVRTVPQGWKVVSSTPYAFLAVPPGTDTSTIVARGAAAQGGFDRGIAVTLTGDAQFPANEQPEKVNVDGRTGELGATQDKRAMWLMWSDAAGHRLQVQVPDKLGLTKQQIVNFADGVTATGKATTGKG
ncbi:hypothetical protein [Actinacidiphila acididurans]|uniref:DUF4245 domain-containing protein n=1 Tax=Actinacidiphila acididurans TaxID=2784346 RepID=A0ABS2TIF1_9ACTN|nr:hypothetical protein [Actinacidiphila acididurans]MBM9503118.1 hypothetical protein [Actinacidiphila acididurans]